jgi:hypothetical protein
MEGPFQPVTRLEWWNFTATTAADFESHSEFDRCWRRCASFCAASHHRFFCSVSSFICEAHVLLSMKDLRKVLSQSQLHVYTPRISIKWSVN